MPNMSVPEHLYEELRSGFQPTMLTTGPWRPDAQHGGPPSALLGHLCEAHLADDEFLARLHVNLLSAIPLAELQADSNRIDVSRRVAHVEAQLSVGDRVVAEARALVLTGGRTPTAAWSPEPHRFPRWDEVETVAAPHWAAEDGTPAFHRDGLEHRFVSGAFGRPGPAVDWIRLRYPVVKGAPLTGFQRTLAVVDVGSGISAVFDPADGFGMINADLDVVFVRQPQGPWLLLESMTAVGPQGTGSTVTHIHDKNGMVALATQSLLGASFNPG